MALERIGLGAVITADTAQLVIALEKANSSFKRFTKATEKVPPKLSRVQTIMNSVANRAKAMSTAVSSGMNKMGVGISQLTMALAPIGLLLGYGIKKAADFEKAMSGVGAVSRANAVDMKAMSVEAQRMGIVSMFTATESAKGMERLARAGAPPKDIIAGLSGVMNVAAADGIELASAGDTIAKVVKGMGREWKEAAHIADVLALASASANTDVTGLGDAFKLAVSAARQMGLEVEETTAILDKLADSGLRGTLGGTAFQNMMTKMSTPTEKATKLMKDWDVKLIKADGSLRKVSSIVQDVSGHLGKMHKVTDRVAAAKELFGLRGMRAYNALAVAGKAATDELENALVASSKGIGAAQEMADRRLKNLLGKLTLLKSSVEGLFIGIFGPALGGFQNSVGSVTKSLNNLLFTLQDMNKIVGSGKIYWTELAALEEKYGKTTVQVALGVRDAIETIKNAWKSFVGMISKFSKTLKDKIGEDGIRPFVKMAIVIAVALGAIAPFAAGLLVLKFAIAGIISIVSGLATVLAAVFWPVLIVVGAAVLAFGLLRKENESFMETASRVWGNIKTWILDVYENAVKPFIEGIQSFWIPVVEDLGETWNGVVEQIKMLFKDLAESFGADMGGLTLDWRTMGQIFITVIGSVAKVALKAVEAIIRVFKLLTFPIRIVLQLVRNISKAIATMISGSVMSGLAKFGMAIVDFLLSPMRMVLKQIIELAKFVGGEDLIPKGLEGFVKGVDKFTEKGFSGMIWPEEERKKKAKPKIKKPAGEKDRTKYGEVPTYQEMASEFGFGTDEERQGVRQDKEIMDIKARDRIEKNLQGNELASAMDKLSNKKTDVEVNSRLCVTGEDLDLATAKHKVSIKERGGNMQSWQYGPMHDHGIAV